MSGVTPVTACHFASNFGPPSASPRKRDRKEIRRYGAGSLPRE
jgi:hypothetical protein